MPASNESVITLVFIRTPFVGLTYSCTQPAFPKTPLFFGASLNRCEEQRPISVLPVPALLVIILRFFVHVSNVQSGPDAHPPCAAPVRPVAIYAPYQSPQLSLPEVLLLARPNSGQTRA